MLARPAICALRCRVLRLSAGGAARGGGGVRKETGTQAGRQAGRQERTQERTAPRCQSMAAAHRMRRARATSQAHTPSVGPDSHPASAHLRSRAARPSRAAPLAAARCRWPPPAAGAPRRLHTCARRERPVCRRPRSRCALSKRAGLASAACAAHTAHTDTPTTATHKPHANAPPDG
jgi:hypothetical protein